MIAGPIDPRTSPSARLRPLAFDATRLGGDGFLGAWQQLNADATIPHCITQLEASHTIDNVRRLAGDSAHDFVGMWFADSDIYKTLEAIAWEHARGGADRSDYVADIAALLARAQESDGYLNSYWQKATPAVHFTDLRDGHELYCLGHLVQAAVAWFRATGGTELLDVALPFVDLVERTFGEDGIDGICGHPEIETALVELFRCTGDARHLSLAQRFVELRGHHLLATAHFGSRYYQDHEPVRKASEVTGHAVRQVYLATAVADLFLETGDREYLDASDRLWCSAHEQKMYVTGGLGSRHRDESFGDAYELPADRSYSETCAAIADVHWSWRMLLATGQSRYADAIERALYNAIAVSTSLDGTRFFYSNPLQVRTDHPEDVDWDSTARRAEWFDCACCPPNLGRLIASLHHYVATVGENGLQLHLFADADLDVPLPDGGTARVEVRTAYPWDGDVRITVPDGLPGLALALRVPGWCQSPFTVTVDGARTDLVERDGYVTLTRPLTAGTVIDLQLPMPVVTLKAHPDVDAARSCVALQRGPVVFALEAADLPDGVRLEDVRVMRDAVFDVAQPPAEGEVTPVRLTGPARVVKPAGPALYTAADNPQVVSACVVHAIPYYRWGNRSPGAMRVWIPSADDA